MDYPKCGNKRLFKNQDGDLECECGKIIYSQISEPLPLKRNKNTKQEPQTRVYTYFDQHRDEILADRLSIGHGKTLTKWNISLAIWMELKPRWVKEGVVIEDLRRSSRRLILKEAKAKVEIDEKHTEEVLNISYTSAVQQELKESIPGSEDFIPIKVGRLEEILRELEWHKGYRQAVLDVFGNESSSDKGREGV